MHKYVIYMYKHEASQVALVVKNPSVNAAHVRDAGLFFFNLFILIGG